MKGNPMNIEDRNAIIAACTDLAIRYAYHVDFGQIDALLDLFIDDAEAKLPGASLSGKQAIRSYFEAVFASKRSFLHCLSNFLIEPQDQDSATGTIYLVAYAAQDSEVSGPLPLSGPSAVGTYHDVYRRTDVGWRLAKRDTVISFAALPS